MAAYDRAVEDLYRAPLAAFVTERKRLAEALRATGDRAGAVALAKARRPTTSAWTVNQLYWHAREELDGLLAAAARLRRGDLGAAGAHREAIARLRRRAVSILTDAGHGAPEALLRRVTTTLAAIAAHGGFDPDPPGALVADRDPPGFETVALSAEPAKRALHAVPARARADAVTTAARERAHRDAEAAERKRREAEAARRKVERDRREAVVRAARAALEARERTLAARRREVRAAEEAVAEARRGVEDAERVLDET